MNLKNLKDINTPIRRILTSLNFYNSNSLKLKKMNSEKDELKSAFDESINNVPSDGALTLWGNTWNEKPTIRAVLAHFLNHNVANFSEFTEFMKKEGNFKLAYGQCQSGKSKFIIAAAIMSLFQLRDAVIVVSNLGCHVTQLCTNIKSLSEKWVDGVYTINQHFCRRRLDYLHDGMNFTPVMANAQRALDSRSGSRSTFQNRIIISLANTAQLKRVVKTMMKDPSVTYDLLIDEADEVDHGKSKNSMNGRARQLFELKAKANYTIGVTATPWDTICNEKALKPDSVIQLQQPADYRSASDFLFKEIREPSELRSKFLPSYSTLALQTCDDGTIVPNVCLIHVPRVNQQRDLANYVQSKFSGVFTTIILNGQDGCMINGNSVPETFTVGTVNIKKNTASKKISIAQMLQYVSDAGVEVCPRVLIISGNLAGRGLSFQSLDYKIVLTDMFYASCTLKNAWNKANSTLIQVLGRGCGRNANGRTFTIHTYETVYRQVKLSVQSLGEQLNRVESTYETLLDGMKAVPMNMGKLPRGDYGNKCGIVAESMTQVVNSQSDGGQPLSDYDFDTEEQLDAVKKAYENTNGILHRVIKMLTKQNVTDITKKDIQKMLSSTGTGIFVPGNFTVWNLGRSRRYKIIQKGSKKGSYKIRPIIRRTLKLTN